ncbi:uncharacterized protein LOC101896568 isoform X2 [Musca domestica]|nr:uncharacterized protein LOC101896568 isoform X2 [Musca domestica]XP_011291174.1 uncharacterized protein LOC101896568 isoform X2 [Musca domestica]XP_011291175.1 uncharacterized protein LOC101896568 isoform X2 [Musca domestica]
MDSSNVGQMATDMKTLESRRNLLKGSMMRIMQFAKDPSSNHTTDHIETRLNRLEDIWRELSQITENLYKFQHVENYVDPSEEFYEYEDLYMETKLLLKSLLPKPQETNKAVDQQQTDLIKQLMDRLNMMESSSSSPRNSSQKTVKKPEDDFPKVAIEPFSGAYKDWPLFEKLFTTALETKPHWQGREKMNYLKSLLRGAAANLIQCVPSSNDSYETAWKRLKEQFDRPLYVVHAHIEQFMNIPKMKYGIESDLRRVATDASAIIDALDAIKQNERDQWLIYILMSKLDAEICHRWLSQSPREEKQTLKTFFKFLNECARDMVDIRDYYKPQHHFKPHPINGGKPLPCVQNNTTSSPTPSVQSTRTDIKNVKRYHSNRGRRYNGNRSGQNARNANATVNNAQPSNANEGKDQSNVNQSGYRNPFRTNSQNTGNFNQNNNKASAFPNTTANVIPKPAQAGYVQSNTIPSNHTQSSVTNHQIAMLSNSNKNTGAIPKQHKTPSNQVSASAAKLNVGISQATSNQSKSTTPQVSAVSAKTNDGVGQTNVNQAKSAIPQATASDSTTNDGVAQTNVNQTKSVTTHSSASDAKKNDDFFKTALNQAKSIIDQSSASKAMGSPIASSKVNEQSALALPKSEDFSATKDKSNPDSTLEVEAASEENAKNHVPTSSTPLPPPPAGIPFDPILLEILKCMDAKGNVGEVVSNLASEPSNRDNTLELLKKMLAQIEEMKKPSSDYVVEPI